VEYQHANRNSIIERMKWGDTPDFAAARSLMASPDVIPVGEMRDAETIATALTAAETGHLRFDSMPHQGTIQSMRGFWILFPAGSRRRLAATVAGAGGGCWRHQLVPGWTG
jgi:twitching motility protein PilT